MRSLVLTAAFLVVGVVAGTTAQAMPVLQAGPVDSGITRVEGGCGPGGHRGPNGRCYPNFHREYRGCPPGLHFAYGRCRPNL